MEADRPITSAFVAGQTITHTESDGSRGMLDGWEIGAVVSAADHEHRLATPADFEGKTIARFEAEACNVWRFWFTDGTAFAIQCETFGPYHLPGMELCDVCIRD